MTNSRHRHPSHRRHPMALAVRAVGLVGLAATLALSGCSDDKVKGREEIARILERADAYRQQGQYRASLIEAQNAIQRAGHDEQPQIALARTYLELGQGKLAAQALDQVKQDSSPAVTIMKARALTLQGKHQSAKALLESLEKLVPKEQQLEYRKLRADNAQALGAFDDAARWHAAARELAPEDVDLLNDMAKAALARNDQPTAEALLAEALKHSPDSPAALITQARMAVQNGRLEEAEDSLSRALSQMPKTDLLTPQRAQALELIIDVLGREGRSAEAMVYTKVLNEANPEGAALKSKYEEALAAYQAGDMEKAKQLLNEIEQQAPGNPYSGTMLGVINYFQGNLSEAQKQLSSNFDPETTAPGAAELLATTQLRLNQPEKVLAMFKDQSAQQLNNPQLLALYGIAALQTGRDSDGVAAINKALELAPERATLRLTLATYYNGTNQPQKALEQLKAAHDSTPHDVNIAREYIAQQLRMGQKDAANTTLAKLLENRPSDVNVQNLAAQYNLAQGQLDVAKQHFDSALKLDEKNAAAKFGLANIALRQKDSERAMALYEEIIAADPAVPAAYKGLVSVLEIQGKQADVTGKLESLGNQHKTAAAPLAVLAEYLLRHENLEEAQAAANTATERDPGSAYARDMSAQAALAQGNRYRANKDYDKARKTLMDAMSSHPQDVRFMALLAKTEIEAGRSTEAEKIITQIAAAYPKAALPSELRGDMQAQQGKFPEAAKEYRAAWQQTKLDGIAQKLAAALGRSDQAQAISFTQEWHKALPRSPLPLILLASDAQHHGDNKAAITFYEQAIQSAPNHVTALNNLAWLYFEAGDKRGLELAEKAYKLAPKEAAVADTYGWILLKTGDRAKGASVLQEAAKLAPDNTEIQQHAKEALGQ